MMFTASSLIILAIGMLAIVLSNIHFGHRKEEVSASVHRMICLCAFLGGCVFRFAFLGTLPSGISAEEALVGVQAKALWQTGGFLFDGGLTTQLPQWTGESTGPLLATITAPFVGILGMKMWVVRMPLALLSCAAMLAAYALGNELDGKRLGRWMLVIYALCPYFVLSARLTCGANAAICLLPIALWAMVKGFKTPAYAYAGAVIMALLAYTQNMYFFISPLVIVAAAAFGAGTNDRKRHAVGAAVLGILVSLPAMMTLWINLRGMEAFEWLGIVRIPVLKEFDKADCLFDGLMGEEAPWQIYSKIWAVITGGVFQILDHANISREMFAPAGMGALYVISLPLMLLGGFYLMHSVFEGRKSLQKCFAGQMLVLGVAVITMVMLILYGSEGALNLNGCTSVFDYSSLLIFDALLMAVGLCRVERKSAIGSGAISALMCICTVMLSGYLFGDGYRMSANTYFEGFDEASIKANRIAEETGAKVNVTSTVYPHIMPADAAEMMYLYAVDADAEKAMQGRGVDYSVIYAKGIEEPDLSQIYLVKESDISAWDLSGFQYEEIDEYVLLSPIDN